jgi:cation-transporting ATPase E
MTTMAYAMGVVRVAGKGALIQEANAVESTSHVDLLCLDKTGTLTTNRLSLQEIVILDESLSARPEELAFILGGYAFSSRSGDRTTEALGEALGGEAHPVSEEVPFSADHKWSALAFGDAGMPGVYVLGAPEVMASHLEDSAGLDSIVDALTGEGLRVLLFAHRGTRVALRELGVGRVCRRVFSPSVC